MPELIGKAKLTKTFDREGAPELCVIIEESNITNSRTSYWGYTWGYCFEDEDPIWFRPIEKNISMVSEIDT